ncbi:MAG: AraC family transcriptional regulator [Alphaproteobacteria bacterium]
MISRTPSAHLHWRHIDDASAQGQRYRSPDTTVELIPASTPSWSRLTMKLPQTVIRIAFGSQSSLAAINSDRLETYNFRNQALFLPARTEVVREPLGPMAEALVIGMAPEFAHKIWTAEFDGKPYQERFVIGSARPTQMALAKTMRSRILSGKGLTALQMESFATLFLSDWAEDFKATSEPQTRHALAFSSILARLDDYIDAHLERDLGLADLAAVAECSPSYFLRAFKRATGQTPHRYLMECRVRRARLMLAQTTTPLVEIAYACGFASQSHMTDVFSSSLGTTPGRYRKENKSG